MPSGTVTNEAKAEIEIHPLTEEKNFFKVIKPLHTFLCFSLTKSLCFIFSKR